MRTESCSLGKATQYSSGAKAGSTPLTDVAGTAKRLVIHLVPAFQQVCTEIIAPLIYRQILICACIAH